MSMCSVFSCVVGRGCLLWPVCSLGKTLLAFALLHSLLQDQICLLLQVFLDFLLLRSSFIKKRTSFLGVSPGMLVSPQFLTPGTWPDAHLVGFLSFFLILGRLSAGCWCPLHYAVVVALCNQSSSLPGGGGYLALNLLWGPRVISVYLVEMWQRQFYL